MRGGVCRRIARAAAEAARYDAVHKVKVNLRVVLDGNISE